MAVKALYIKALAGQTRVSHPELAYAEVMHAMFDGKPIFPTTGTPNDREYRHEIASAELVLDPTRPFNGTETVYAKIKY